MAQSAFAAGGGNAKMAQLKKLQANRNLSPAALRKLVEQIGRRNLKQNEPQRPRQGQGSRRPIRGTGATSSSRIDSSKYDMDSQPPKGPNQVKPLKKNNGSSGGSSGSSGGSSGSSRRPAPKPATLSAAEKKKRADAAAKKAADAAAMKAELLKIRKAELAAARQKAYKKSLEQAKKNRARGNTRPRGPRG